MPPQKNSGRKGAKRDSGASKKNNNFNEAFMSDVAESGGLPVEGVYVGRVLSSYGGGRLGVFYIDEENQPRTVQAIIRGIFRGKAKKEFWIEAGSIVIISDNHIGGSAEYEIMSVLSDDDVTELRKMVDMDGRIFDINNIDPKALLDGTGVSHEIEFTTEETLDVDKI
jgi:hypothetical protein